VATEEATARTLAAREERVEVLELSSRPQFLSAAGRQSQRAVLPVPLPLLVTPEAEAAGPVEMSF
jgi:hypothetical protein